jgi:hypothetical protein
VAGSGSAWTKPRKRTGLRPAQLADRPHPSFVRTGQRYFPLHRSGKNRVTIKIGRPAPGGAWDGARDDGHRVRVTAARLLAADEDGRGRYYRFVGYAPRRYDTHAIVIGADATWTRLVLPEWHPSLTVTVSTGTVPPSARALGAWLRCSANLGAERAAHLEVDRILPPGAGFDPARYPPVTAEPPVDAPVFAPPAAGPGCGDIVLFASAAEAEALAGDAPTDVYVTGHPPPIVAGARVYVHASGQVRGWRRLTARRPRPNGTTLSVDGSWQPCVMTESLDPLAGGIAAGEHGRQRWAWRSWAR